MKHRKHKAAGGGMESASSGTRDYAEDLRSKPSRRDNAAKIENAAEERKRGGRAKKLMGKVDGDAMHLAGRKARKSGGRAGAEMSPLSSAHKGTPPRGHKGVEID
jgi:hypothetical protein